jgi:hypothetical protein
MLWLGIVTASFVIGVVLLRFARSKRLAHDLGSVSARWVADHRIDAP